MSLLRINNQDIRNADIFETVIGHFPDIIHSVDGEGNIVFANRTAETLLGYPLDQLLQMNVRDLYADEVLEELKKGFDSLKQTGESSVESLLKDQHGTLIPVEIRSFSIYDDEGNFIRTFSILRDIRKIKELQLSLVHAGRLAAIGELASGIVHDINNPLSVILLALETARMSMARSSNGDDRLGVTQSLIDIERAAESIRKLVAHLRGFSRGMVEHREPIDLGQSVEDALFLTKSRLRDCKVTVENRVERGRCFTAGCPNHIEQVFANLISNACDAMETCETRHLSLTIGPTLNGDCRDYWQCVICDTGSGIPADVQDSVFKSFYTTKAKGHGTGLGLSIVRGIVADHQGEIDMESKVGEGTTFRVRLQQFPVAQ